MAAIAKKIILETDNLYIAYGLHALPLKISHFEVQSYILSNGQYVFSMKSIQKVFHYEGKSDFWLADVLNKASFIPSHLLDHYENPIIAKSSQEIPKTIRVVEAAAFAETCRVIALSAVQLSGELSKIYKRASAFYKAVAHEELHDLIAEASGFRFQKTSVKNSSAVYLAQTCHNPAFHWLKTLHDSFIENLFDIYDRDWLVALRDTPGTAKIFYDVVFSRLNNELLQILATEQPKRSYTRKDKSQQETMHPQLRIYIEQVSSLLDTAANNQYIFLQLLHRAHPVNANFLTEFRFTGATVKLEPEEDIFRRSLDKPA